MSVYKVTGRHRYRDHAPGSVFEATLDPDVEERAVRTGAIRVVERSVPQLKPGTWRMPPGWEKSFDVTEAPEGASVVKGAK